MNNATAKQDSSSTSAGQESSQPSRKRKFDAYLVTLDDELWPQVGAHLSSHLNHRQLDSIDELLSSTRPGEAAIVLWDARGAAEQSAILARLAAHSPSFAVIVLDVAESASGWAPEVERGQVVAHVAVPLHSEEIASALGSAYDEASARLALLGDGTARVRESRGAGTRGAPQIAVFESDGAEVAEPEAPAGDDNRILAGASQRKSGSRFPRMAIVGALAIVLCALAGYMLLRRPDALPPLPPSADAGHTTKPAATPAGPAATEATQPAEESTPAAATEEKVDALVSAAQIAMRDRHFIEPMEGSALSLYRSALLLAPGNGEAQQGLKRLSEILVGRVQSALDEKQFEAALQALETVRSIDPSDPRLAALDDRIAKMRDELGPAEIEAAINAQNFDRAAQLIDQAARAKSMSESKLAQLREDLRRHHADSDVSRILALLDARLDQEQLIEPANDSAVGYFAEARKAGAMVSDLQTRGRELVRRLTQQAHKAIDERQLADADRLITALRSLGTPPSIIAGLQHDIGVVRAQQVQKQSDQFRILDLIKSRLAQGSVASPENDSALYYLGQLRGTDPQNPALPELTKAVQSQLLGQAGDAIDAAELAQADALLQMASSLGSSPQADALAQRLRSAKTSMSSGPQEVAESSLTRLRVLDVEYPSGALQKKIQGTVEIGYVITPKGAVSDIKVLDANPTGIFETAATKAISRLRYKPTFDGHGKPIAVSTKMLVIFRPST
ncbi:MAG: TonB family protein [Steroidobacteraceae bacterium]